MMDPYNPAEPLARLIDQLEKGWQFVIAGWKIIANKMMVSKGITFLEKTDTFNEEIWECHWQSVELKKGENFNRFFHRAHR